MMKPYEFVPLKPIEFAMNGLMTIRWSFPVLKDVGNMMNMDP